MPTTTLTPDQLDRQAALLHDTESWQQIVAGWDITTPEPVRPISPDSAPHPRTGIRSTGAICCPCRSTS